MLYKKKILDITAHIPRVNFPHVVKASEAVSVQRLWMKKMGRLGKCKPGVRGQVRSGLRHTGVRKSKTKNGSRPRGGPYAILSSQPVPRVLLGGEIPSVGLGEPRATDWTVNCTTGRCDTL